MRLHECVECGQRLELAVVAVGERWRAITRCGCGPYSRETPLSGKRAAQRWVARVRKHGFSDPGFTRAPARNLAEPTAAPRSGKAA